MASLLCSQGSFPGAVLEFWNASGVLMLLGWDVSVAVFCDHAKMFQEPRKGKRKKSSVYCKGAWDGNLGSNMIVICNDFGAVASPFSSPKCLC